MSGRPYGSRCPLSRGDRRAAPNQPITRKTVLPRRGRVDAVDQLAQVPEVAAVEAKHQPRQVKDVGVVALGWERLTLLHDTLDEDVTEVVGQLLYEWLRERAQ